jgi:drug/metabolite transporter (DMT)-like permease
MSSLKNEEEEEIIIDINEDLKKEEMYIEEEEIKIKQEPEKIEEKITKTTILAVLIYVILFSSQVLLIKASSNENEFDYNTTTVILLIEFVKLIFSIIGKFINLTKGQLFNLRQENDNLIDILLKLKKEYQESFLICLNFSIPAFLYAVYNNILFYNVVNFGPGVYKVLMNIRIPITGLLTIIFFKKKLTLKQWTALISLTYGCVLIETTKSNFEIKFNISYLLILFQAFLSSFAGN